MVLGHDLSQKQRVEHRPDELTLAREPSVGRDVERKYVEHQSVRNVDVDLIRLDHGVVCVGDCDEDVARKDLIVGFEQAEAAVHALFTPERWQLLVVLAREHDVDVVVPRHKAALAESADQTAAYQPEGEVVLLAEVAEIYEHIELLELQLAQQLRS